MNVNNLHQTRAEIVDSQVKSLEESIQKQSRRLKKQQHFNTNANASTTIADTNSSSSSSSDDEEIHHVKESNNSWTNIYQQWDTWEDVEEMEMILKKTKKKLSKLKKNNERLKRNITPSSSSTFSSVSSKASYCCNSQNRIAEREVASMSTKQRLKHMKSFRDNGNKEYHNGNYKDACKWYDKSLIYYEYCFMTTSINEKKNVEEERILCLLNLAACYLGLKKYTECIESCTEILNETRKYTTNTTTEGERCNSSNTHANANTAPTCSCNKKVIKALFRRARALRLTHKFQQAKDDLDEAMKLMKLLNDYFHLNSIENEYKLVKDAIKVYECNSKKIAKRMMKK